MELVIANKKYYKNLPSDIITQIKEDLTLVNPAYVSAKKYSKYRNISIPPYIQYYKVFKDTLITPRGYTPNVNLPNLIISDERVQNKVDYPKFVLELREEQDKAVKAYLQNTENGILCLPTGMGKSITGIYIADALSQKTLIIMHKEDLISGWRKDIEKAFNNKVEVGIIKGQTRTISEHITLATIQTLNRLSPEELNELGKEFGLVILDEMHHVPASSYEVINFFHSKYRLGLTATPERDDGLDKVMNFYFGDYCYIAEVDKNHPDILNVKVYLKKSPVKYTPKVKFRGREMYIDEIPIQQRPKVSYHTIDDYVVRNKEYINLVCNDIKSEYERNRSIIVFFNQVDHCNLYFDSLKKLGIPEEKMQIYIGGKKDSSEMLEKAERKEVLITLATLKKATEGTNVKSWEVAFLVSSIKSGKNVEQAVGRIRRYKEGKINPVLLYDYRQDDVYSMKTHSKSREDRYRKLKFEIEKEGFSKGGLFSRGFRR